jgi:hypothetical protein
VALIVLEGTELEEAVGVGSAEGEWLRVGELEMSLEMLNTVGLPLCDGDSVLLRLIDMLAVTSGVGDTDADSEAMEVGDMDGDELSHDSVCASVCDGVTLRAVCDGDEEAERDESPLGDLLAVHEKAWVTVCE